MLDKLYIIIVTYNAMQWLPECLVSTKPYSVIIVDNNSSDGTVEFIQNEYPEIKLLRREKNLGFGQANNVGIKFALTQGANYVFLLNQDAYLGEKTIEKLIHSHQENPKFGMLSPIHYNGKGDKLDRLFFLYLNRYSLTNSLLRDSLVNDLKNVYETRFVNAAGWLLPKSTIEKVGYFDSLFFHYGEDRNYCQRLEFHNLKIGIVPNASIKHDREFRKSPKIIEYSKEYYSEFEKLIKIEYADVNYENIDRDYLRKINYFRKNWLKQILLFNFRKAHNYRKKSKIMNMLLNTIKESRTRNI